MKLSLMLLNIALPVFLDEHFQPRKEPDWSAYEEILANTQKMGFTAVDISATEVEALGAVGMRRLLDQYGLRCASVVLFENLTSEEDAECLRIQEHMNTVIDLAAEIGASVLMLNTIGCVPGRSRESHVKGLIRNLRNAVAYAGDRIRIAVEDYPSTEVPMCAAEDIAALLREVPGLGLVYDSANMMTVGEAAIPYFFRFMDHICYYHLKDVRFSEEGDFGDLMSDGRRMITTKIGTGQVSFAALQQGLSVAKYEGYCSLEYAYDPAFPEDYMTTVCEEKAYLEDVLKVKGWDEIENITASVDKKAGNANLSTRRYLDSLYVEERLIGAVTADLRCEIFGKTYASPIMTPAFSHLAVFGEGRKTGMEEYSAAAGKLQILNWVGMMENDVWLRIAETGADTVRIVKPYADHDKILDQIRFAEEHGAVAVGIDIDHVFDLKGEYDLVIGEKMGPVSREDLKKYVESTRLPFVLKGVLSVKDAVACAEAGVKGILVSHHHGRMPFAMPPLAVLPEIRKALEGSGVTIFVDCGINSGADAFKALQLGADAVAAGRILLPALTREGEAGVIRKLTEMNEELRTMMNFTGCRDLKEKDASLLRLTGELKFS